MKFAINTNNDVAIQSAYYKKKEYSIITLPAIKEIGYDICVNKLIFSLVDEKILQIWGYVGGLEWEEFKIMTPVSSRGHLMAYGKFEYFK